MTDSANASVAGLTGKAAKAKVPRTKPAHPPANEMVQGVIKSLEERGWSSLIAMKKYIAANYKVDVEKLAPFIKRALKSGVTSGMLVQTKVKGASGSFQLTASSLKDKPAKKPGKSSRKPSGARPKKTPNKSGKKQAENKKSTKSPVEPRKSKAKPTKAKKAKSPAKNPKAPKLKKYPAKKVSKKAGVKK